jgi:hypothetical protein
MTGLVYNFGLVAALLALVFCLAGVVLQFTPYHAAKIREWPGLLVILLAGGTYRRQAKQLLARRYRASEAERRQWITAAAEERHERRQAAIRKHEAEWDELPVRAGYSIAETHNPACLCGQCAKC